MALEVINLKRVFVLNGQKLSDPNPDFSVDEVMGFYSVKYPELTTATVSGPEVKGDEAEYQFKSTIGTKG
jgi:PRTRC genetic system protein C